MKYCINCGKADEKGGAFCTNCGRSLSISNQDTTTQNLGNPINNSKSKTGKIGLIMGMIGVVVFSVLITIFIMAQYQNKNKQHSSFNGKSPNINNTLSNTAKEKKENLSASPEPVKDKVNLDISQIDTSEFPQIKLYFSVKDLNGNTIDDIHIDELEILERTTDQWHSIDNIYEFDKINENYQKTVAIVMDTSGSMEPIMDQVQNASINLLNSIGANDNYQVSLTSFNSEQNMLHDFTDDVSAIISEIDHLYADGMTAFYDTLENTLYKCNNQTGQKYILAFSDGEDNASLATKDQVIELSRKLKIPIYIITDMMESEIGDLLDIAKVSGGELYQVHDIESLRDIYMDVFKLQRDQMYVSYETMHEDQWCDIQLQLHSDIYQGVTEDSYLAEKSIQKERIDNRIIESVLASSELAPQSDSRGSYNYYAKYAVDGNYNTAWVEGVEGNGEGEWLQLNFDQNHSINGIEISNGYKKRKDLYLKNNRLRGIRIWFSDNTYEDFFLTDTFTGTERLDFSKEYITRSLKIEILSVYEGNKYQDTCITDINIY